jgi:hypothetical protein
MAHFAKIDDNKVSDVIVVSNDDCNNLEFPESEPIGQEYIASLGISGTWLQCSYNANYRGCYPASGWAFASTIGEYGEFIPPA